MGPKKMFLEITINNNNEGKIYIFQKGCTVYYEYYWCDDLENPVLYTQLYI